MMFRSFVALLTLGAAALTAGAADDENPYKNTKVGDYAKYALKAKLGFLPLDGTVTQTVAEKTDKEATLKIVLSAGGNDTPFPDQKIDLTKPLDPTKGIALPGFGDAKLEKLKDGKEKIKVGGKEYDTTWTSYKVKIKVMDQEIAGDMKAWMTKDMPGMVKMTMNADFMGQKIEMTTELKETGTKK